MSNPKSSPQDKFSFFEDVYAVARLIPRGRVSSYGAIARYLGNVRKARIVGYAMNGCSARHDVPAHRVVNSQGILSGKSHFSPDNPMEEALRAEGIVVVGDKIQDFARVFWDPGVELAL